MSSESNDQRVHRRASTYTHVVHTVFWLNLLVLGLFVTGLLAGWVWPETETAANRYRISLVMNTAEAKRDWHEIADASQSLADVGAAVANLKTVQGQIREVDRAAGTMHLVNKTEQYQVHLTAATEYELDGKTSPDSLSQGDSIRVTMREKDNQYFATQIISDSE